MKNLRKLLALLLVLAAVLGMVACNKGGDELKVSVFWYDEADVYLWI